MTDDLVVDNPVRLIGDEHNPSNVVVETSGTIVWRAAGGFIEGVAFRRPKLSSGEVPTDDLLRIENKGRLGMVQSIFDNEGSSGDVVKLSGEGFKGRWESCLFQNGKSGISLCDMAQLEITQVCTESKTSCRVTVYFSNLFYYILTIASLHFQCLAVHRFQEFKFRLCLQRRSRSQNRRLCRPEKRKPWCGSSR